MYENVGASTSHNPKGLHGLYRENFTFTIQRIYLFSDDIYCDSALVLGHIHVEFSMFLMLFIALTDGLCCAWFVCPILCWCRCPEIGSSSIS
jgi:hypothetical protein